MSTDREKLRAAYEAAQKAKAEEEARKRAEEVGRNRTRRREGALGGSYMRPKLLEAVMSVRLHEAVGLDALIEDFKAAVPNPQVFRYLGTAEMEEFGGGGSYTYTTKIGDATKWNTGQSPYWTNKKEVPFDGYILTCEGSPTYYFAGFSGETQFLYSRQDPQFPECWTKFPDIGHPVNTARVTAVAGKDKIRVEYGYSSRFSDYFYDLVPPTGLTNFKAAKETLLQGMIKIAQVAASRKR